MIAQKNTLYAVVLLSGILFHLEQAKADAQPEQKRVLEFSCRDEFGEISACEISVFGPVGRVSGSTFGAVLPIEISEPGHYVVRAKCPDELLLPVEGKWFDFQPSGSQRFELDCATTPERKQQLEQTVMQVFGGESY